jgi:thiosulfate dehydrogenase
MAQWKETNPNSTWEQGEIEAHQVVAPEDNSPLIGTGQSSTYGVVTQQTVQVWKNETYKTALYGSKVFHSGDELGSEIAVSCDMCHPRAAKSWRPTIPRCAQWRLISWRSAKARLWTTANAEEVVGSRPNAPRSWR